MRLTATHPMLGEEQVEFTIAAAAAERVQHWADVLGWNCIK